ncbi:DUF2561 family protein [Mycolicibacterium flavescens]|uniref:Transmembrane protein n=1 Tax=Mycolicibacterium flavescens TaxID=1776 RepID=A0A1E3RMC8_MYCFV|nr:DUF2561 family protein [Mycolicibacterium flavescens]MCV7281481.1 DUF2561 family protein [Mycolicibacterium flavescens]ODQ91021.1 hypothetical protein BHQ18_06345 [Mycolicibacterium flavescens]
MTYDTDQAGRSRLTPALEPGELDRTDRILLGACAGIWLVALGSAVAAVVALVDLGTGSADTSGSSGTPWLLYTVIGVSAVVIVGAVPLLLRARREAMTGAESAPAAGSAGAGRGSATPAAFGTAGARGGPAPRASYAAPRTMRTQEAPEPYSAAVDQLWLRCGVAVACAIGIAMVAIGVGTYLMAVGSTVAAWVFFVLAALVTLAMPAVPWFYLKELRAVVDR